MRGERVPAIVVGLCAHGLAIARSLHRGGVSVFAFEQHHRNPGISTRSAQVIEVADINGDGLIDALLAFSTSRNFGARPILFLTNDRMIETIARHIELIRSRFQLSWAGVAAKTVALLDKGSIEARCVETGLAYPRSCLLNSAFEASSLVSGALRFPIIIKPTKPLASFKTLVVSEPVGLQPALAPHATSAPFLAQEFIPGGDEHIFFCALYLHEGQTLAHFEGRKLRSRPMGHTTIARTFPNAPLLAYTEKFFRGLKLSGPVSLEIKLDSAGTMWVIEPTMGRTDFWVGLCVEAGIDLPLIEYQIQTGQVPAQQAPLMALWLNGERDPHAMLWLLLHRPSALLNRRVAGVYISLRDPLPFLRHISRAPSRVYRTLCGKTRKAFSLLRHRLRAC
jgi:predicted ATP-grasp superfamily ATP-dependent carboligase